MGFRIGEGRTGGVDLRAGEDQTDGADFRRIAEVGGSGQTCG